MELPCELPSSVVEPTVEELSDRSESNRSRSSSRCSSSSSGGEGLHAGFQPYKGLEAAQRPELDEAPRYAKYDAAEMPIALDKPKDYAVHRTDGYSESSGGEDGPPSGPLRGKKAMYSLYRDLHHRRQKSLHVAAAAAAVGKDLELIKTYGLPLEGIKDFSGLSASIGSIVRDSLRAGPLHGETTAGLEPEDLKSLQQLSSRAPSGLPGVDATIAFERLRHAHPLCFQAAESGQVPGGPGFHQPQQPSQHQQPPPHQHHPHQHHPQQQQQQHHQQQQQHQQQQVSAAHQPPVTQLTQMQHVGTQHHHQQQPKSFTIDAILGLRGGVHREKQQRHHPYRKQQGQENSVKGLSASSCSNVGNSISKGSSAGGKLKRVRTIFTAEQLERLEREFARQQYMVGPERLYLAHALGLTEAQVKVWFQNRRIKWRKLHHEQTSQRLHELERHLGGGVSAAERDDSSETATEW